MCFSAATYCATRLRCARERNIGHVGAQATLIIKVLCRPSALWLVARKPTHFAVRASGKGQYRPRGTSRQSGLLSLAAWAQQCCALARGLKRDAL